MPDFPNPLGPIQDFIDALDDFIGDIQTTVTDAISDSISSITDGVKDALDAPLGFISDTISTLTSLTVGIGRSITDEIGERISSVTDTISSISDSVTGSIATVSLAVDSALDSAADTIISAVSVPVNLAIDAIDDVREYVGERVDAVISTVDEITSDFGGFVDLAIGGAITRIDGMVTDVIEAISPALLPIIEWLGDRLEGLAEHLTESVKDIGKAIGSQLTDYYGFSLPDNWGDLKEKLDPVLKMLEEDENLPAEIKQSLEPGFPLVGFLGVSLVGILLGATVGSSLGAVFAGPMEKIRQGSLEKTRPSLLMPNEIDELLRRHPDQIAIELEQLTKHGYSDELISARTLLRNTLLGAQDSISLWHRAEIQEDELDRRLGQLGYIDAEIAGIKTLAYPIPPVQDLIRFAVREVFTPEIATEFGIFEDFPPDFSSEAGKHGLSEFWQLAYWGAHWELPSAQMGFEMLHRGVITTDQMDLLLRAADVMPYWRDKITAIAYSPFTRVDIRRMHKLGVLSDDDVTRAYMDIGYSPEKAKVLTEFTIRLNDPANDIDDEAKALTRAQVLRFFRDKLFSEDESMALLTDIGYDVPTAQLFITLEVLNEQERMLELRIRTIKAQYRNGLIDYNDAVVAFDALELPSARRELILAEVEMETEENVRLPTRADLDRFYKADLLEDIEYVKGVIDLGYSFETASKFLYLVSDSREA